MLAGGHHNSLGRTVEVVDEVLADLSRLDDLFDCYKSSDEVVRLRTSSALKRIFRARPDLLNDALPRIFKDMGGLNQPSAKWTFAQVAFDHSKLLGADATARAKEIIVKNLLEEHDWIVLIMSMKTCGLWVKTDKVLADHIMKRVLKLETDPRKSVAKAAKKLLTAMGATL